MINQGHLYMKTYMKSFVYLFQRMHGMQYLYDTFACTQVAAEKGADKLKSEDDVDEGYDFIESECPKTTEKSARNRWMTKELNLSTGPIFGWTIPCVKEAITNMSAEGSLATTTRYYPFCYDDVAPWLQKVLDTVIPSLATNSILFIGKAGMGRTPVMNIIAMAIYMGNCTL